ncbi:OmpP1/FadL family transporter [Tateyamaria armeniaca]|uniref:OmpP1/FadL family transporter n=1 Tax=Tateyamaria armeniaca TaxID=2518930 RepID=A0ABW8UYL9_9RHOB
MKTYLLATSAILMGATAASAAGIERTNQSVAPLFETGRYLEFSYATVSPSTSGVGGLVTPGAQSGDLTPSYDQFGFAYKADINEQLSYALIYDQPYGADVDYPAATGYFAQGSTAAFDSNALSATLRYKFPNQFSVYGGLRYQVISANAFVPFVTAAVGPLAGTPYEASASSDGAAGYLLGASYEIPDIALRVSLTYQSSIKHDLDTVENTVQGLGVPSSTEIETPQSLTLDFQTGIAQDTLLFGSVRWVDWSSFEIAPQQYVALVGSPLVFFDDDRITWTLGVGRRLNEQWSIAGAISYEETTGSPTGNLGPTDGLLSLGLSAVYTQGKTKITTGIRYVDIGNAQTRVGAAVPGGVFQDNHAIAFGVKIGYNF